MPIIKRAIKKLRHDRKRSSYNAKTRENLRSVVKTMRKSPSKKNLTTVYKTLDKAAKTRIIHANKAARLKSRLAKLVK
jgi:small subunit ribosomal protein S20